MLAPAKLNLHLHVTGKRADGYHLVESLVAFTEYGDEISVEPASSLSLEINGPFADGLRTENNLVMKAAKALQAHAPGRGARMTLTKNLPVGAGLGGGSSDAAAALKTLAKHWGITLSAAQIETITQSLGSDVPVCYAATPAWVSGIGENIIPVKINVPLWAILCNPRMGLLTADVYQRFSGTFAKPGQPPASIDSLYDLQHYLAPAKNMLEPAAFASVPVLQDMLSVIATTPSCLLARMSGSGATCFGLYASRPQAEQAVGLLQQRYPGYWLVATKLQTPLP